MAVAAVTMGTSFTASALKPYTPKVEAKFKVESDLTCKMNVTVTAPANESVLSGGGWWSYEVEGDPLPEGTVMTINLTRNCSSLGESDIPILTQENVTPGQVIEITDTNADNPLQQGYKYTYYCTASITEGEVTETSSEGYSSSTLFGVTIDMPKDYEVVKNENSGATITYSVPTTYSETETLPVPVTSMALYRLGEYDSKPATGAEPIQTIENPAVGEPVVFTDPDAVGNGKNRWYIQATCSLGTGGMSISKWLGYGRPANVSDLTGVAEGTGVKLTWTAPTYSQDSSEGAEFDPAMTHYKLYRTFGYGSEVLICEDVAETTYTDNAEDVTEPVKLNYRIVPFNVAGEGSGSYANGTYASDKPFVVGPLYTLPFEENVSENKKSDKLWLTEKVSGAVDWEFLKPFNVGNSYNPTATVEGMDGTGVVGVNYAYPYNYSAKSDVKSKLTSYGIDFSKVGKPVLSFYYYAIPATQTKFDVIAIADGVETVIGTIAISDDTDLNTFAWTADNWRLKEYDLSEYAGAADFRIAFSAWYENDTKNSLMISKVNITDNSTFVVDGVRYAISMADVDPTQVTAVAYEGTGDTMTVPATVTYNEYTYDVTDVAESAFAGHSKLVNATVEAPNIHAKAFENCPVLAKVVMGEATRSIMDRAFGDCAMLKRVEFAASPKPTVAADAFQGIHAECTGQCPDSEYANYEADPAMDAIDFDVPSGVAGIFAADAMVNVYTIEGARVLTNAPVSAMRNLAPGIYVVANGEKTAKVVIR